MWARILKKSHNGRENGAKRFWTSTGECNMMSGALFHYIPPRLRVIPNRVAGECAEFKLFGSDVQFLRVPHDHLRESSSYSVAPE